MDGSFGELIFYSIEYSFLLISIICSIRLIRLRKDNKKHNLTKICTFIFTLITLYLFIGSYYEHKQEMKKLEGIYNVEYYKSKKCYNCSVNLKNDGTYKFTKNQQIIETGNWNFTKPFVTYFIIFNNGNEHQINPKRTILSID